MCASPRKRETGWAVSSPAASRCRSCRPAPCRPASTSAVRQRQGADGLQLRQAELTAVPAVEQGEPPHGSFPEFLERDASVEIGVRGSDGFRHVEQAVAGRPLKPAADAELVEFQSPLATAATGDGAASSRDRLRPWGGIARRGPPARVDLHVRGDLIFVIGELVRIDLAITVDVELLKNRSASATISSSVSTPSPLRSAFRTSRRACRRPGRGRGTARPWD